MLDKILEFIEHQLPYLRDVISYLLGLASLPLVKFLWTTIKNWFALRDLKRLEKSYSSVIKFAKRNLLELGFLVNKLPDEIVVEIAYKDDRALFSKFRSYLKKNIIKKIKRKECFNIIVFSDMSYDEQIAFIIQKAFESIISYEYEKVLGIDFRESLVLYYSYKFAFLCEKIVGKKVVHLLERKFNEAKFKDIILKLDSKELEERVTLNPPPEVRPLLDRVIIPIIELKNNEIRNVNDLSAIELTRKKMHDLLNKISEERIGIIFIGIKNPDEYLHYIKERIDEFEGILICTRGKFTNLCEYFIKEIGSILWKELNISRPYVEIFEGDLPSETNKPVHYKYVLIFKQDTIKTDG